MENHLYNLRVGTTFSFDGEQYTVIKKGTKAFKTTVKDSSDNETFLNSTLKIWIPDAKQGSKAEIKTRQEPHSKRKLQSYRTADKRAARKRKLLATIPRYLHKIPRPEWKLFIAYAIEKGQLKQHCADGCKKCFGIGWVGTISPHEKFEPYNHVRKTMVLSAPQYGIMRGCSRMQIKRLCETNKIPHFKLPQGRKRYVIYNTKAREIFVPESYNPHF